ncbi:uncharacterized protein LOC125047661 [Penaeus chinensis]|uniref:uncharacterized protein LOC125047661 n=1 Tax=Penaeus chinensis TaxID=139456 RepID=UPI001FB82EA1|nr:uncharacterized protein LOC125047661 [Penaeus chinensis]
MGPPPSTISMTLAALLLATILAGGSSQRLPHHLRSAPGAVVENLGLVYLVTSHVEVRVSLSPLRNALELMAHYRDQITSLQRNLTLDPSHDPQRIHLLNQTLSLIISSLDSFRAHGLFGFLDGVLPSDLQEYRKSVSVVHIVDSSAEVDDGGALTQAVQELVSAFSGVKSELVFLAGTANETSDVTLLTFELLSYQIAVNRVTESVNDLVHALRSAVYGEVAPNLISLEDLYPVLRNMSYYSLSPLFPLKQHTRFYASLKSFVTPSSLSIMIPVRPSIVFKAFRIHPFPHKTNNSHYVVHTDNTLIFRVLHGQSISYPPTNYLNTCSKPTQKMHVCYSRPLPLLHEHSCAFALVTGIRVPSLCYFDVIKAEVTPFVLSLPEVTLLYFYRSTFATIICEDNPPDVHLQGTYVLPHHCEMDFLSLHIPATKFFIADFHSIKPSLLTLPTANVTIPASRVVRALRPRIASEEFDFYYPVYVNLVGMFLLVLMFGACYLKAYKMHREEEIKQSKTMDQSVPCLSQSEAPPAYSEGH